MAAPTYNTDLDDSGNTLTSAEEGSGWTESSDTAWDDQGPPAYQDGDYAYIQGSYSVTADTTKTGTGTLLWDYGSTFTIPTDGAMLVWINFYNPNALDTYANGGLRAIIGSAAGTFYSWDVGGSDYGSYPYGGWQNFAVNDTVSADDTVNSYAGGSHQFVGAGCKVLTGIGKGESFQVDVIRKGRCTAEFAVGDSGTPATIAGFAAVNDATSARWGLVQAIPGGYLWKGHMSLGTASTAVYFDDSDVNIFIQDTPRVTANFNTIEILNVSSTVNMTGFSFLCLDPTNTASKGRWITSADATVTLTACSFTDMSTFVFDSNTTVDECTFKRCGQITAGGASLAGSSITGYEGTTDTGALVWDTTDDPNGELDNMTFAKGAAATHAIEFSSGITAAQSQITLTGIAFGTAYNGSDSQTDSTLYFADTTGTLTVNLSGCSGNKTYKSAGATITLVDDPVTFEITVVDGDGDPIESASVLTPVTSTAAGLPFNATINTITRVGTTATATTAAAHGLATDDYVRISGCTGADDMYNGAFQVTVTGTTTFTYTMGGTPSASAAGSPLVTFCFHAHATNASGIVTDSRVLSADQPVAWYVRKSSSSPYYQHASGTSTVLSASGRSFTVQLVLDE